MYPVRGVFEGCFVTAPSHLLLASELLACKSNALVSWCVLHGCNAELQQRFWKTEGTEGAKKLTGSGLMNACRKTPALSV